jgi:type I restriction enzyme S subunit
LQLEENEDKCISLTKFAEVFNPPVFKRQFCENLRLGRYNIFRVQMYKIHLKKVDVYVFRKQAEALNLLVHTGDILV